MSAVYIISTLRTFFNEQLFIINIFKFNTIVTFQNFFNIYDTPKIIIGYAIRKSITLKNPIIISNKMFARGTSRNYSRHCYTIPLYLS